MTNGEKYKTIDERTNAFNQFCDDTSCSDCPVHSTIGKLKGYSTCVFAWLELDAEKINPLPCPFCGGEVGVNVNLGYVFCKECYYNSCHCSPNIESAIAEHNRVTKAVMDAKYAKNAKKEGTEK